MPRTQDVLPLSDDLYAITHGWPTQPPAGSPFVRLAGAGRFLDEARRSPTRFEPSRLSWPEAAQPVGVLYREDGVRALASWATELADRLRPSARRSEPLRQFEFLRTTLRTAADAVTPLLRPYRYADQAPEKIVIIVNARKSFVFWDTEMIEGSSESIADMGALWTIGEAVEQAAAQPCRRPLRWRVESAATRLARSYERRVRDVHAGQEDGGRSVDQLNRLLEQEASRDPWPCAAEVIPSRAELLWRPERLELVDLERLRRWLHNKALDASARAPLDGVLAFLDSASREHADVLLDAFCTDSPEVL